MSASDSWLSPSEAARALGISTKALRVHEQRGLLTPKRTESGWRVYGPDEMSRAREIVALRQLGLSLAQVAQVLAGDASSLEPALASHQRAMEARLRDLTGTLARIREARSELSQGTTPPGRMLAGMVDTASRSVASFDLPWPWGGELFELNDIRPLNYIVGPLGSGKTRFALKLAETLPGGSFVGPDRPDGEPMPDVEEHVRRLVEDGATASDALAALLGCLHDDRPGTMVVDMVEQGLDERTQETLIDHLRHRPPGSRPLFLLTRSSAILDLELVGTDEAIYYCPANHSPPLRVLPFPGAPGYEALATCLATPQVRARTEGIVAMRPDAA